MPAKRNDIEEESAAEREIAFTRIILAWVLVLIILFWITSTPSPTESSSVQFLIRGSLGGGDASTQSECAEGAEMIHRQGVQLSTGPLRTQVPAHSIRAPGLPRAVEPNWDS